MEPNIKKRKLSPHSDQQSVTSLVANESTSSSVSETNLLPSEIILHIFDYYEFPLGRHINFIDKDKAIEYYYSLHPNVKEKVIRKKYDISNSLDQLKIIKLLMQERMIKLLYGSFKTNANRQVTLLFKHVSLFGYGSLAESPSPVIREWKSLRKSCNNGRYMQELQDFVTDCPMLETVSDFALDDCSFEDQGDYSFPSVRELGCSLQHDSFPILDYFPNLTSLDLDLSLFDETEFEFDIFDLKFLKNVKIFPCPSVDMVVYMLEFLEYLEKIDIFFTSDSRQQIDRVFANVNRNLKIRSVKLSGATYTDKFYANMNDHAQYLTKLESLNVLACESSKKCLSVKDFLKKFNKLKELSFDSFTDSKFKKVSNIEYLAITEDVKNPLVVYPKKMFLVGFIKEEQNWHNVCELEIIVLMGNVNYLVEKYAFPNLKKLKIRSQSSILGLDEDSFKKLITERPELELDVAVFNPNSNVANLIFKSHQAKSINMRFTAQTMHYTCLENIASSKCENLYLKFEEFTLETSISLLKGISGNQTLEYIKIDFGSGLSKTSKAIIANLQSILELSKAANIDINGETNLL